MKEPAEIKVDVEKAQKWLSNGAQPTDTVKRLFDRVGLQSPQQPKRKQRQWRQRIRQNPPNKESGENNGRVS